MRYSMWIAALALSTAAPSVANGADGYKASATVSRRVPVDVLTISFHLIERSHPERESRLRAEEARIREEIKKSGANIVSWTSHIAMTNAGFSSTTLNYINPPSTENQAVDTRRNVTIRLTGVSDAEPIAAVLGRNAIRHGVTFQWGAQSADQVKDEIGIEAIAAAVAKARNYAAEVGGQAGAVMDLAVMTHPNPAGTPTANDTFIVGRSTLTLTPSFGAAEQLIEDDKGRALIVHVTAHVTLQAKAP